MESQPQNPELRNNADNYHPCTKKYFYGPAHKILLLMALASGNGSDEPMHLHSLAGA